MIDGYYILNVLNNTYNGKCIPAKRAIMRNPDNEPTNIIYICTPPCCIHTSTSLHSTNERPYQLARVGIIMLLYIPCSLLSMPRLLLLPFIHAYGLYPASLCTSTYTPYIFHLRANASLQQVARNLVNRLRMKA